MQVALQVKAESEGRLQLSVNTSTLDLVDDLRPLDPQVSCAFPQLPSPRRAAAISRGLAPPEMIDPSVFSDPFHHHPTTTTIYLPYCANTIIQRYRAILHFGPTPLPVSVQNRSSSSVRCACGNFQMTFKKKKTSGSGLGLPVRCRWYSCPSVVSPPPLNQLSLPPPQ